MRCIKRSVALDGSTDVVDPDPDGCKSVPGGLYHVSAQRAYVQCQATATDDGCRAAGVLGLMLHLGLLRLPHLLLGHVHYHPTI